MIDSMTGALFVTILLTLAACKSEGKKAAEECAPRNV